MNPIHDAMAVQLDRYNNSPKHLREVIDRLTKEAEVKDTLIAKLQQQIIDAEADRCNPLSAPSPLAGRDGEGLQRPAVTLAEAAEIARVSYHCAYRYFKAGHWAGYEEAMSGLTVKGSNKTGRTGVRILIYTDQSLSKPPAKKRRKKAANVN